MHILLAEYDLHLPASQSLKDKRSILKRVIHRLRSDYNVAIAEVDYQDKWQMATIAVVTVSAMRDVVEQTERRVFADLDSKFDVVVAGVRTDWL